jgi:hypothetical protein
MIAINQIFDDIVVTLDGGTFHHCTFNRCHLRFNGLALPDLDKNTFNNCQWDFGTHAGQTLTFMQILYHDHGGEGLVETLFARLRDRHPLFPVPGLGAAQIAVGDFCARSVRLAA